MRKADIGIVPTLNGVFAGEALSTKSLEFLAVGTPMIISRTTSTQYYYDDSMVMFFKPGDHYDLARCIIELYKDRYQRKALTQNAERFNQKHSWGHYKKIYLDTVDSLVE
jgi:glycosyltransferase involved in cell wall biosynthesis